MSAARILSGEIASLMLWKSGDSFTIALPTNADAGVDFGIVRYLVRYLVRRVGDCVEVVPCDVMGRPLAGEAKPEDGAK